MTDPSASEERPALSASPGEPAGVCGASCGGRSSLALPLALAAAVAALTFVYALNQSQVFDWDACFRAFTGFAGRDLVRGLVSGDVRSRPDVLSVLTHYSDFYEARPGSLVSYPPLQTFVLGVLGFVSTHQLVLSLFNVAVFAFLSVGVWRLCDRLGFGLRPTLIAWSLVCLHPTVVLTVWSMRRGLFEAAVVCWCVVWLIDFRRDPTLRVFLRVVAAVVGGFLYRETLALVALPAAVLLVYHAKRIRWEFRRNRCLLLVAGTLVAAASLYATAQIVLAARGRLSMFAKTYTYVHALPGGPPTEFLTMRAYYSGQFGPEEFLGLGEAALKDVGAPEECRLARGRWSLPVLHKIVYVTSSVFANRLAALLLFLLVVRSVHTGLRRWWADLAIPAAIGLLYWLMLCPLGGIPDYVTPILPCLACLGGGAAAVLDRQGHVSAVLTSCALVLGVALAASYLLAFATGRLEEYPPHYDYDGLARSLLEVEAGPFGVAVDNHLVKNLAYSKLKLDPQNRMACYSLRGGRLPLEALVGKDTYSRFSPLLDLTRPVPGVRMFVFRSHTEERLTEEYLTALGFRPPFWDQESSRTVGGSKRFMGQFRPAYIRKLRASRPEQ